MGLNTSIAASKYPMSTDIQSLNDSITNKVIQLAKSPKGEGHDQFLTGIRVNFDLTCSNKMWIEAERYRFLEFVSSQSTMHRITQFELKKQCNQYVDPRIIDILQDKINLYKYLMNFKPDDKWFKSNELDIQSQEDFDNFLTELYLKILYNIPSGFELTARMTTNYRSLKTIYSQRKNHKLPEWKEFCKWITTLPEAELLIIGK